MITPLSNLPDVDPPDAILRRLRELINRIDHDVAVARDLANQYLATARLPG
ncbi:hypothetical protein [Burkholderia gladioli]|uniref:hypothetical protein n=1 Tax=Burkholderia gladioli TaxID=28095 RepID=UPI00285C9887|nr:hypothetical protein [Burkholderia gladioli]MDR8091112.1 hypothetical protein [Burkholderia gladioli]